VGPGTGWRAAVFAAAIVLIGASSVLAGCGDDAEQVTAEELVSRGDEICAEGRKRFDEVQSQSPPNASAAAEQTDQLVELATDELNELRDIRPPDELRERYERYLEARGRALELLEQGQEAAREKDADTYAEAQAEAAGAQPERLKLARAVGFKECSKAG
jgi:ElaB/YqjD/DUF883 family membrane-anchored ribosome-binding protein